MFIDIAVNLGSSQFDKDREEVLKRASDAQVNKLISLGTSVEESRLALSYAVKYPSVYATAGVHPHDAKDADESFLEDLANIAASPKVIAIGECGLDFNRDFSPRPTQERVFAEQLQLAKRLSMPLVMHQRDAHERFLPLYRGKRPLSTGCRALFY